MVEKKPAKTAVKKTAVKKTAVKKATVKKTVAKKAAVNKAEAQVAVATEAKVVNQAAPEKAAVRPAAASVKKLNVTLVRSKNGRLASHKACVAGLGLRRIHQTVQVIDTPENRGMINRVRYMLKLEEA